MNRIAAAIIALALSAGAAFAQVGQGNGSPIGPGSGGSGGGGGGSGTVTSIATGCQATGGTITTTGTISTQVTPTDVTGANPPITTGYCGGLENLDNGSNQVPTIAVAGSSGFPIGWYTDLCNINAGTQTVTPASGTIGGASTYVLAAGTAAAPKCVRIISDGVSNYLIEFPPGAGGAPSGAAGGSLAGTYPNPTIASSVSLPGSPTTTTQAQADNSTKVATTAYTDLAVANAVAGVNPAISVSAATTAAGDTSGCTYANGASGIGATLTCEVNTAKVIDGFTFNTITTQSLLVKNDTQSPSGAFNGIYNLTALQTGITGAIFTRRLDYDTPSDINNTGAIPVISGTANATTSWLLTTNVVTVGTTALSYTQFSINPTKIVTALTCPGSAAASAGAVTCVTDYQLFAAGASGNWTKPTGNYTITRVCGSGAGGSGGSGAIVTSGTASSGGGGGGGALWQCVDFKTVDLAGTVAYAVAAATTGGAAKSQTASVNGNAGAQGANTTWGATLHTWYGGGPGGAGQNSATNSTGGGGGGAFAAATTNTGQCAEGTAINTGGSGGVSNPFSGICPTGGGGTAITGAANAAGYSANSASGGGSGSGITTVPGAAGGSAGGLALGCQATGAGAGGAIGVTPSSATQDFSYHPGCGGGGGGSTITATGATAGSGAAGSGPGAGGGGGGSALASAGAANTSGAGGAGGGGVLVVVSF